MKFIPITLVFSVVILVLFSGCIGIKDENQNIFVYSKYTAITFEIDYPKDWNIIKNYLDTEIMFKSQNVNINIIPINENISNYTAKDIAKEVSLMYQSNLVNYVLLQETNIENIYDVYELIYTSENFNSVFKKAQYFIIHDNNGFIITYTAGGPNLSISDFEKYLNIVEHMVDSFRFK